MERRMNEMELLDAATVSGLPKDRFDEMERSYNSRSYRCALHMRAMLRRPKTVRFQSQGILRELKGTETVRFSSAVRFNPLLSIAQETADFAVRKELNYFARFNN
jgi:hypothetical protein